MYLETEEDWKEEDERIRRLLLEIEQNRWLRKILADTEEYFENPENQKKFEARQRQQKALATEQGGQDEEARTMVGI